MWRLLRSESLYELPRVRELLLPTAWLWIQKRLPKPKSAQNNKKLRERLEFVRNIPPWHRDEGEEDDDPYDPLDSGRGWLPQDEKAVSSSYDTSSLPEWSHLIASNSNNSSGNNSLPMTARTWKQIGQLLSILSSLPYVWMCLL